MSAANSNPVPPLAINTAITDK